ncbi:MAG: flavin reductase family protein [Clostridiales bacterium]|nr:flavin reductase family protein [Clostridiales bacterium]
MSKFIEISPSEMEGNAFHRIGKEWMLVAAGGRDRFNTMTASWGGVGVLWNVDVSFIFIRPERYTYEFLEKEKFYSLSFLGEGNRRPLQICGSTSGRDTDKIAAAGLTPVCDAAAPYFAEAEMSLICRKLYFQDLDPAHFLDPAIAANYQTGGLHRLYVGEIQKVLRKAER